MTVEPVVRGLGDGEWDECRRLDDAARERLDGERGGAAWLAEHPRLASAPDGSDHVVVGVIDGVVVGFAIARVEERPSRGRVMVIDRAHVATEARGLGFGDALLGAVIEAGRASQCVEVEGVALPGDRETKNMFERAGVTARSIVVSKRLD